MFRLVALLSLLSLTGGQFVFFGGQGRPQSRPQSRPQTQGFSRLPVAPQSPSFQAPQFSSLRSPQLSSFRSAQQTRQGRLQVQAPAPAATPAAAPSPRGNHVFSGRSYLLTWRTGQNSFDWRSGVSFCQSQGMRLVSLDSSQKTEHFLGLLETDRAPYFWAGGQVSRDSRQVSWQSGKTEPIARGQHPWSFTGRTGPQPDGGETCVAVLNNTYRDGVKFHDVACNHEKPVICEEI